MGIIMLLFGIGAACLFIWKTLAYAIPAYLGFATAFWSFAHGAGAVALPAGLLAAAAAIAAARLGVQTSHALVRWTTAVVMVTPAGYAGYSAASEIAPFAGASQLWQVVFSALAALCVAATAFLRLREPGAA
jgi:hypothetical protein